MPSRHPEPNKTAIYATALTAFFAIAGIAIVDPILPVIGEEIGASTWQIELLFTAYIAVMAVGMIPAVIATGRFGYRAILATGVTVVAVAAILAALSGNVLELSVLRGLWGLGNAMFFATAMVLLVALANDREWVVELFETCVGLGFAVGPLLGGLLGQISWRIPFAACGLFMIVALAVSLTRLKDPEEAPRALTLRDVLTPFRRPAFRTLCVVTGAYNFVFFVVLGYTPVFLGLDVIPLGLVFTAWGIGLAVGILVIGHRLAHRIGAVATVGTAIGGLLVALVLLATSAGTAESIVVLVLAGICMGIANANLTDLALGIGGQDRRTTTAAFNLVRWGFAAPAPVLAGLLHPVSDVLPFWVGAGVLVIGVVAFAWKGHGMAHAVGESLPWARRQADAAARSVELTPEEAIGEV
ncbi:MFS transporter [Cellulomonas denverensis]|uniref:MFS transporter n=1 Tax=Cellulomonas denverensis TaxID=264297 RepID=A0A7X6QXR6_9CELL|nr:MFS transporter [Cellulomonas denverensis]NKY21206.1 MFS transporter [Cellulomonas denverensis]GIG24497.1 multidrug resistance protein [Cellulomonas denverensis]